jgi:hypothetical protein
LHFITVFENLGNLDHLPRPLTPKCLGHHFEAFGWVERAIEHMKRAFFIQKRLSSLDDELCTFCTCQSCHARGCAQVGVNSTIKTDDNVVYFKSFDI